MSPRRAPERIVRRTATGGWARCRALSFAVVAFVSCRGGDDRPGELGPTECGTFECAPRVDSGMADADDATDAPGPSCPTWDTTVTVNPGGDMGVLTPEEFWALRTGYVDEYSTLGIFPDPYLITGPAQSGIYGSVDWSVGWFFVDPFYLENPYLLSFTGHPGFVGAAEAVCSPAVKYGPGCTVTVAVPPEKSKTWFEFFFDSTVSPPGQAQLTLVNALDAGFNYASIDTQASENVDAAWNAGASTIVGGVCPITKYFYHHGQSGLNNLSPNDTATNFAFVQRDVKTRITTRLWRAKPASTNVPPDITYVLQVE